MPQDLSSAQAYAEKWLNIIEKPEHPLAKPPKLMDG